MGKPISTIIPPPCCLIIFLLLSQSYALCPTPYTATDGSTYDSLNKMINSVTGYNFTSGAFRYFVNVCENLDSFCAYQKAAVCRGPRASGVVRYVGGVASSMTVVDGKGGPRSGVIITYQGGEECRDVKTQTAKQHTSVLYISCNTRMITTVINKIEELDTCNTAIYMASAYACPSKSPTNSPTFSPTSSPTASPTSSDTTPNPSRGGDKPTGGARHSGDSNVAIIVMVVVFGMLAAAAGIAGILLRRNPQMVEKVRSLLWKREGRRRRLVIHEDEEDEEEESEEELS